MEKQRDSMVGFSFQRRVGNEDFFGRRISKWNGSKYS